jgi:hypothetical protein
MSGLDVEREADTFRFAPSPQNLGGFTMFALQHQKNRTGIGAHPGCEKSQ